MARINLWETVVNGSGLPISGASVDVYLARTTTDATIFAAESGGGTLSNPVTTTNGTIPGWVDEGEYDLHVTGVGITETTKRFNAVLGGNPAKAVDSITSAEIGADQVGTSEIAPGAVTGTELAADSVIAGKIAAGAISQASDFGAGVVDSAALGANSVIAGKIAAAAVEAGDIAVGGISAANQFAAGVVDAAAIAANAVGASELADDSVANANVQDRVLTPGKFNFNASGSPIGSVTGSGGDVTLTTTFANLTGLVATVNPSLDGAGSAYGIFIAQIDCSISANSAGVTWDETAEFRFTLNGTDVPGHSFMRPRMTPAGGITGHYRTTLALNAGLNLSGAGAHTIRVQGKIVAGDPDTSSDVHVDNCGLTWFWLGVA